MVKFSIIVPVYNAEKYLIECVSSLLNQTYKPYEIILIDDESKDNSPKLCDELVENNKGIVKCLHKKNAGPLSARIDGIKIASGDYYYFVDSDDFIKLDALETFKTIIEEDNPDGIFLGAYNLSAKNEKTVIGTPVFNGKKILENKRDFYKTIFHYDGFFAMWRKLFKAELFDDIDYSAFIKVRHGEDLLQSLHLLKKCKKVVGIDNCLYVYRENPISLSHQVNYSIYKENIYVHNLIIDFLRKENVFTLEDWDIYCKRSIYSLIRIIDDISISKALLKDKIEIFDYIANSNYYTLFASRNNIDDLVNGRAKKIFKLFNLKRYRRLILFTKFYHSAKRLKHLFKGVEN